MNPAFFKIHSCHSDPVRSGWEQQLAALLGSKPRRLSAWCELGLWGALSCLHKISQTQLSSAVSIRVYSENSTLYATHKAIAQAADHLPMPVTFMQTLPGQLFNSIGMALDWHGDGCSVSGVSRRQVEIGMLQQLTSAAMLAWVEDMPEPVSRWMYLEQAESVEPVRDWSPVASIFETSAGMRWLQLNPDGRLFQAL